MTIAYHVNYSKLEVSQKLPPSTHFFSNLENQRAIEELFESKRPTDKPTRYNAIYVFEKLENAKHSLVRKRGFLYEVSVEKNDILHIGDWNWLGLALKKGDVERCTDKYWTSSLTDKPNVEWIIKCGIIKNEINISQKEWFKILHANTGLISPFET